MNMFKMFDYGKKAGYMGFALLALATLPLLAAALVIPGLPEQVAMSFDSAGQIARSGSRYELLFAPVIAFMLGIATYGSAAKQASAVKESQAMARVTAERYLRNGIVVGVVLVLVTAYLLFGAATGHGIGF